MCLFAVATVVTAACGGARSLGAPADAIAASRLNGLIGGLPSESFVASAAEIAGPHAEWSEVVNATGRSRLTALFLAGEGSGCRSVTAAHVRSSKRWVELELVESPGRVGGACIQVGVRRLAVVDLGAPLGNRRILEPNGGD